MNFLTSQRGLGVIVFVIIYMISMYSITPLAKCLSCKHGFWWFFKCKYCPKDNV